MSGVAQAQYDQYDIDDDWRPMDYGTDADDPPPDINDDPPPADDVNSSAPPAAAQMDVTIMPDIVEPPPPVEKKPRAKKVDAPVKVAKPSKEDAEIDAALDRYMQTEHKQPSSKQALSSRIPKSTATSASSSRKSKMPTGVVDVEKHQSLLMQIDRYRISDRFKDVLKVSGLRVSGIEDHSIEELESLLTRIRTVVGNRSTNGGGVLASGIIAATSVVENLPITNRFVNIHGMAAVLSEDPEFADIAEQLSIDYSIMSVLSPEKRMAFLMFNTGMKMNSINNMKTMIQSKMGTYAPANEAPIVAPKAPHADVPVAAASPLQDTMRVY